MTVLGTVILVVVGLVLFVSIELIRLYRSDERMLKLLEKIEKIKEKRQAASRECKSFKPLSIEDSVTFNGNSPQMIDQKLKINLGRGYVELKGTDRDFLQGIKEAGKQTEFTYKGQALKYWEGTAEDEMLFNLVK